MREIDHTLNLGESFDLPPITIQGDDPGIDTVTRNEPVFPGDADIVHMQNLYRPDVRDIDTYKFTLTQNGKLYAFR